MRMIDADALMKWANDHYDFEVFTVGYFVGIIQDMPTVDAEPVRHGKWIIRGNPGTGWYRITCSECGEDATSTAPCIGFFPNAKVTWDYCPECGAKMDGEDDDETD